MWLKRPFLKSNFKRPFCLRGPFESQEAFENPEDTMSPLRYRSKFGTFKIVFLPPFWHYYALASLVRSLRKNLHWHVNLLGVLFAYIVCYKFPCSGGRISGHIHFIWTSSTSPMQLSWWKNWYCSLIMQSWSVGNFLPHLVQFSTLLV